MGKVRFYRPRIVEEDGSISTGFWMSHDAISDGDYWPDADYRALERKLAALVEAAEDFFNPKTRVEDDMLEAFRQQKAKAEKVRAALDAAKEG